MSATKPKPFVPTNPVGADLLIETMRTRLASAFTWLDAPLGRGVIDADGQTRVMIARAGNRQDNDYYYFQPNDLVTAQCCFVVDSNVQLNEYKGAVGNATYSMHLLFTYNMAKISTQYNYDYTENLVHNVLTVLSRLPFFQQGTINAYSFGRDALTGYIQKDGFDKFTTYPYGAFRIDFDVVGRTCLDDDFVQYTC